MIELQEAQLRAKELRRLRNKRHRDKTRTSTVPANTILALMGCGRSSQLWPVYSWDQSKPVYHLTFCTLDQAYDRVVEAEPSVTRAVFNQVVDDYRVAFSLPQARKYLDQAIEEHYAKRRDRRVVASHELRT